MQALGDQAWAFGRPFDLYASSEIWRTNHHTEDDADVLAAYAVELADIRELPEVELTPAGRPVMLVADPDELRARLLSG
jgi:hypothetical protein